MKETEIYDYIIVGAGAAGLMLGSAMALDPYFSSKKILLLDPDPKDKNDRSWCFWSKEEKEAEPWQALQPHYWSHIGVSYQNHIVDHTIAPYRYTLVEAAPFYALMKKRLSAAPQISLKQEAVSQVQERSLGLMAVSTEARTYLSRQVFDSRFNYKPLLQQQQYPVLQQHFIGWFVKSNKAVFNSQQAVFMDFSVPQKGNTRFMYLLPSSPTEALVEYTLFSPTRLQTKEYEKAIEDYLSNLGLGTNDYEVQRTETGSIPMSCYPFEQENHAHYLKIGTAGGWSKPSTGYTFQNSHKKIQALIPYLKTGKPLHKFHKRNRFWWYDRILLRVLSQDNSQGKPIFEGLFKKRSAPLILKFLAEDTHFLQELYIMSAAPLWRFTKAFFRVMAQSFLPSRNKK